MIQIFYYHSIVDFCPSSVKIYDAFPDDKSNSHNIFESFKYLTLTSVKLYWFTPALLILALFQDNKNVAKVKPQVVYFLVMNASYLSFEPLCATKF